MTEHHTIGPVPENADGTAHQRTRQVRREQITEAIDRTYGNKKRAAAMLKMHRSTLYRKLRSL
jgi:DNA-binding NtrC family response regulator